MKYKDKSLEPVIMFLFWLLCFAIICIVGISNVFAASYDYNDFSASLYDNYGPQLHYVLTTTVEGGGYTGTISSMTANTSGAAWGFSSPIPLVSGRTYSISINPGLYNATSDIVLSTYNRIGVGTTLSNAVTSYQNNTNAEEITSRSTGKYIQYVFKPTINANFIVIPFATSSNISNASFSLTNISLEDLGSSGVSETTINNSLNNQTNELNNSISNSTNIITGEINDMQQSIIDSNKETQEVIKDQFKTCGINLIENDNLKQLSNTLVSLKDFIEIKLNTKYNYHINDGYILSIRYFNKDKTYLGLYTINNTNGFITFNNSDIKFISLVFSKDTTTNTPTTVNDVINMKPYFGSEEICLNKLDEQNETSKGILGKIKDLFNWLTNNDDADVSSAADVVGWLPSGPVDSLINLPLTMLNNINASLSKTCFPLTVKLPYVNKNVEIPCLSTIFNQITGLNSFWTWVGTIASAMILFNYLIALYNYYDRLTDLQAQYLEDWGGV